MRLIPAADAPAPSRSDARLARQLDVSVIVPTLDEAENLPPLLARIERAMGARSWEAIIVDDDSTDGTPAICEQLALRYPLRLVIRHRTTDGLSGAVLHGMAIACGRALVVMDADLQHPPEAIPYLLAPLNAGDAEFTLGSRYVPGGTTAHDWTLPRRLNSGLATLLARPFATSVRDPMSGFFALRRDTFQRARRLAPLGYKIALELICKCRVRRVVEVPIHFGLRTAGRSKLTLKQQAHYLRHLARLYAFTYARTTVMLKAALGAALGFTFARWTNPVLTGVLTGMSAVALIFVTRDRTAPMPARKQLLRAEHIFPFDELAQLEQAA
jgi:dolichol-phosphate mannosyltransferase